MWYTLQSRMQSADDRYGNFASVHEALGVAMEEWDELRAAIHANKLDEVQGEAIDLAAVLLRLVIGLDNMKTRGRSIK
jgi:NTP pyrophosphatase (non-canonical NTP hydrolase)